MTETETAAETAAANSTAPRRSEDRFVTTLRGVSMAFVFFIHCAWTYVPVAGEGAGKALVGLDRTLWLNIQTWFFIWMIAGFFASSGALLRNSGREPLLTFWRRRAVRLLVPYYLFVVIVLPIQFLVLKPIGVCADFTKQEALTWIFPLHVDCLGIAQGPFWFLMVFIPICLCIPLLVRVFDSRFRFVAPILAVAALVLFDLAEIRGIAPDPRSAFLDNMATFDPVSLAFFSAHIFLFWTLFTYTGFFYADGYVQRLGKRLLPLGLACLAVMVGLILLPAYGDNGLGYSWEGGNQFPPTMPWLFGSTGYLFLFVYWRAPIERWSLRPVTKRCIDWLAEHSLTILIWHLVVYEFIWWILRGLGILPDFGGLVFVRQVFWLAVVVGLTIPTVMVMSKLEGIMSRFVTRLLRLDRTRPPKVPATAGR